MAGNGNNGNHGKKGVSGRKSAYAERADAETLWKIFSEGISLNKLQQKINSKNFSILDRMILSALMGNERFVSDIFKKLFPDTVNFQQNLNQKQMSELENDLREILATPKLQKKKQVNHAAISDTVMEATKAITLQKKKKIKV